MNRPELDAEINRINQLYQEKLLELKKLGGTPEQQQRLLDLARNKKNELMTIHGDDLQKLNGGGSLRFKNVANKLDNVPTSLGKKALSILPFAGAAYGLASGDPAMAAEEAIGDVPVLGQAYEAIRPTESGNPEEEQQMLAERNAQEDYTNSPARFDRLKKLLGK